MTKLNLGSKHRKLEGFDNLDKIFGWHFQDGLGRYPNNLVDGITISHAIMFLTNAELATFLKEAGRVLRTGGVIRITEDDTENPKSAWYKTGNIRSGPNCLTGPKMLRDHLERAGFRVHDVDQNSTHFYDSSLMQAYRGGPPNVFFIEGIKGSALKEAIKNQGNPYKIEECSRNELPQFFCEMGYKVGAEVGVYKGAFTEKFCKAGLKMYAIDPWMAYKGAGRTQKDQNRQDFLYSHTQRTLAPYKDCKIIRAASMDAVKEFEDGSLDFVYLDGDHSFKHIAADLVEWSKKVRPGGAISGHDYFNYGPHWTNVICQVKSVVDAYVEAFEIGNLYVFGELKQPIEKDDRVPSWMFFKK